jgi:hypothetical protein
MVNKVEPERKFVYTITYRFFLKEVFLFNLLT